jgi:hypothetical protein
MSNYIMTIFIDLISNSPRNLMMVTHNWHMAACARLFRPAATGEQK